MEQHLHAFLAHCATSRTPLVFRASEKPSDDISGFMTLLKSGSAYSNVNLEHVIHHGNGNKYARLYVKVITADGDQRGIHVCIEKLFEAVSDFISQYDHESSRDSLENIPALLLSCAISLKDEIGELFPHCRPNGLSSVTMTRTPRPTPEQRLVAQRLVWAIPNFSLLIVDPFSDNFTSEKILVLLLFMCAPELFFTESDAAMVNTYKTPAYSLDLTHHLSLMRTREFFEQKAVIKADRLVTAILDVCSMFPAAASKSRDARQSWGHKKFIDVIQKLYVAGDSKSHTIASALNLHMSAPHEKVSKKMKMSDSAPRRPYFHVSLSLQSSRAVHLDTEEEKTLDSLCCLSSAPPSATTDCKTISYGPRTDPEGWVYKLARLSTLSDMKCAPEADELDNHGHACLLQGFLARACVSESTNTEQPVYLCADVILYFLYLYSRDDNVVSQWIPTVYSKSLVSQAEAEDMTATIGTMLSFFMSFNRNFLKNRAISEKLSQKHAHMLIKMILCTSGFFNSLFPPNVSWHTELQRALKNGDLGAFESLMDGCRFENISHRPTPLRSWKSCRESVYANSVPLVIPPENAKCAESLQMFGAYEEPVDIDEESMSVRDACAIFSFIEYHLHDLGDNWSQDVEYKGISDQISQKVIVNHALYPIYRKYSQFYTVTDKNTTTYTDVIYHPSCDFTMAPVGRLKGMCYDIESMLETPDPPADIMERVVNSITKK